MVTQPCFKTISVFKGILSISQNQINASSFAFKHAFTLIKLYKALLFMKSFKSPFEGSKLNSPLITLLS